MNILMYLVFGIYILLGGGSTLFITGYMFVILAQKISKKIRTGASLYD